VAQAKLLQVVSGGHAGHRPAGAAPALAAAKGFLQIFDPAPYF